MEYLSCLKKVKGVNEEECRQLAKNYLSCRMDRFVLLQWFLLLNGQADMWIVGIWWQKMTSRTWGLRKTAQKLLRAVKKESRGSFSGNPSIQQYDKWPERPPLHLMNLRKQQEVGTQPRVFSHGHDKKQVWSAQSLHVVLLCRLLHAWVVS